MTHPRKLVFATNNSHKLEEIRGIIGDRFDILSLKDIGCDVDIPETGTTLEENSLIKARYVKDNYGLDCFADDTGLEVDALGGEPGVRSARYAPGEGHDSKANMRLLLEKLEGVKNRNARFKTVITLIYGDGVHTAKGIVEGVITESPKGDSGFGYDPVFMPEDSSITFAEMTPDAKNAISHRGRATAALIEILNRL